MLDVVPTFRAFAIVVLLDSDSALDFDDEPFEPVEPPLPWTLTGFVVIQMFNANFSSALKASHGVIYDHFPPSPHFRSAVVTQIPGHTYTLHSAFSPGIVGWF